MSIGQRHRHRYVFVYAKRTSSCSPSHLVNDDHGVSGDSRFSSCMRRACSPCTSRSTQLIHNLLTHTHPGYRRCGRPRPHSLVTPIRCAHQFLGRLRSSSTLYIGCVHHFRDIVPSPEAQGLVSDCQRILRTSTLRFCIHAHAKTSMYRGGIRRKLELRVMCWREKEAMELVVVGTGAKEHVNETRETQKGVAVNERRGSRTLPKFLPTCSTLQYGTGSRRVYGRPGT